MKTKQKKPARNRPAPARRNGVLFADVAEAADRLSEKQQRHLIELLERRLVKRGRDAIIADVREGLAEYERGEARVATVDQIMRDIES